MSDLREANPDIRRSSDRESHQILQESPEKCRRGDPGTPGAKRALRLEEKMARAYPRSGEERSAQRPSQPSARGGRPVQASATAWK